MEKKSGYLDTCIWLNLFKKEGDPTKGIPYWKLAKDFIENVEDEKGMIFVSTINLKELSFKLEGKFDDVKQFFKEAGFIEIIKTANEDYNLAREFEQNHGFISFYDYLHVAIAKRLGVPLITRDGNLPRTMLKFSNQKIYSANLLISSMSNFSLDNFARFFLSSLTESPVSGIMPTSLSNTKRLTASLTTSDLLAYTPVPTKSSTISTKPWLNRT